MLALYRAGRQGEALAAYTQARRRLVEELGLEPGGELRTLQRQILAADPELDAPASPAARTPTGMAAIPAPCQLPPGLADFTGRLEALRDARRWMEASDPVAPTVTVVTGKAGVGKTAVAVRLAHQLRPRFPDGQLFVNLRGAGTGALDPAEALTGLLGGLGVDRGDLPQNVDDRVNLYRSLLADRRVLVLLDNAAGERQLRPLLPSGVGCAALVTSRARLAGLEGAHTLVMDVFRTDEALELLARIAGPQRVAAEQEAARAVVEYCGRLPLAVRIAAARLVTRPERRLWTLARALSDERRRLDELRAGDLEVRASIALSYQSQDEDVRRALRLLGLVGADTFPAWLPAALLGLDPEDDTLAERLLDAGLLEAAGLDAAGQERYQFHDLVRVYARERLADQESGESRRAAVERAASAYLARAQGASRDWFAAERASLVATVQQAHAHGLWELTWRLALAASDFFEAYSHWDDWSATHELALDAASRGEDPHAWAVVRRRLGDLRLDQSNWSQALAHYSACLPVFRRLGDRHGEAHVLCGLGDTHREQGRLPEALHCFTACLPIFREVGDLRGEAETLRSLGIVSRQQGKLDDALAHLEECVRISAGLDDPRWQAIAQRSLGMVHRDQERLNEARACFERSLAALRAFGDRLWQAYTLNSLGQVLCEQGAFEQAEAVLAESVSIFEQLHDRCGEAYALQVLGDALAGQRRLAESRAALDRSLATFRQLQHRPGEAWALQSLGDTLNAQGHPDQARELLEQALRMARELSLHPCEARAQASLDAIAAPAR
jgi:tetratricopeptide (TPR) repeat protein